MASTARGFLGAGDLYIDRQVAGVFQGMVGPFEADKFELKPNSEQKELISKGKNTYGQAIETVALSQPAEFSVDLLSVVGDTLVLVLLGTSSVLTQTAASLTAADVTAKLDKWVSVGKRNLTGTAGGTFVLTNTGATITYTEGTHYIVNRDSGMIKALSTGTITEAQALKLTTPYGVSTGTKIDGATQTQIRAHFFFDGKNAVDDTPVEVDVWEAVLTPSSPFDFLGDDFNQVSLSGKMKTPTGKAGPFEVRILG